MRKLRIDPRTGIVALRPSKKPLNRQPASPQVVQQQAEHPPLSTGELLLLVREMGEAIARELQQRLAVLPLPRTLEEQPGNLLRPSIDESIVDVGIGPVQELQIGDASAGLGQEEIRSDSALAQAKKKLQMLKGNT